ATPPAAPRTAPGPPPASAAGPRPAARPSALRRPVRGPGWPAARPRAGRRSCRGTDPGSGAPSTRSAGPDRTDRAVLAAGDRAGVEPGAADSRGIPPEPDLGHRGPGPSQAPPGDIDVTNRSNRPRLAIILLDLSGSEFRSNAADTAPGQPGTRREPNPRG